VDIQDAVKRPRLTPLSLTVLGLTLAGPVRADEQEPISIHREELLRHGLEGRPSRKLPELTFKDGEVAPKRAVYGYLPYWTNDLSTIRWSALTHIAWFSVGINADGSAGVKHDWPDTEAVEVAHAAGVKVDLAFTLFDNTAIANLCNSPTARAKAINTMITQMEAGGADGVSIDFEFVNAAAREGFVTLMKELRAELVKRGHPDAEISIAGPAVDWAGGIDLPALLETTDWFFVMGYDYFWSGSNKAGPVGIFRMSDAWQGIASRTETRSIAEFTLELPAERRRKMILGVPYYGREWKTVSGDLGASVLANVGAVMYHEAKADLAKGFAESLWDEGSKTPWYRWQDAGVWHQVYYDDAKSLAAKYEFALAQDLGGVGMWALNFDKPHQELWNLLETTFAEEPTWPVGHRDNPVVVDAFPFKDTQTTVDGPSHYFNFYSCDLEKPEYGREWVYRVDVCQPGTLSATVPDYEDRDPDLHVLGAPTEAACIARGHTAVDVAVKPGRYYVVVDSYVAKGVAQEGEYELTVDFTPEAGSSGCASHLTCDAGDCVCPGAGQTECDGACVDVQTDAAHCGACGEACSEGQTCVAGACTGEPPVEEPPVEEPPVDAGLRAEDGCGCAVPGAVAPRPGGLALAAALVTWMATRRRRSAR